MHDEAFWELRRKLVPADPPAINLNAGTLFPTPIPIMQKVTELRCQQAAGPSDFLWRRAGPLLERSRAALAGYLDCSQRDLLLLPNVTWALNILVPSLELGPGDEVLTTDHEYGAMLFCWRHHAKQRGFTIREMQLPYRDEDPAKITDALAREIRPNTRVLYFSHVTTSTGLALPARELCASARRRGVISIIDGAHAPGMLPVSLAAIEADYYLANCHKWMMAPAGAGFLHAQPAHRDALAPLMISWGNEYDRARAHDASDAGGGTYWQRDMEFHGTADRCGQMVLADAIEFRAQLGGDEAIRSRVLEISDHAREKLSACGLICATPQNRDLRGALCAFELTEAESGRLSKLLWENHHIECPTTRAAGKAFLRVSCAWFVSRQDIDRLADAVKQITKR